MNLQARFKTVPMITDECSSTKEARRRLTTLSYAQAIADVSSRLDDDNEGVRRAAVSALRDIARKARRGLSPRKDSAVASENVTRPPARRGLHAGVLGPASSPTRALTNESVSPPRRTRDSFVSALINGRNIFRITHA